MTEVAHVPVDAPCVERMGSASSLSGRESRSSGHPFLDWLVTSERVPALLADRVDRVQRETSDRLASILLKLGLLSEHALQDALAEYADLPKWNGDTDLTPSAYSEINEQYLRSREVYPIALSESEFEVAVWDALDDSVTQALEFATGVPLKRRIGTRTQVLEAITAEFGSLVTSGDNEGTGDDLAEAYEIDRLKDLASDAPVIRLVLRLIDDAIVSHASDIHLERSEVGLQVRLRVDGLLKDWEIHTGDLAASIVSRIKVMAGLDIAERRLPQDGRIRVSVHGRDIDLRVATSPTIHGESVVLRILDRQDVSLDFTSLGLDEDLARTVREANNRAFGIFLVTGPTGSGKTTTLYAALKELNTAERKILTVEDPVEYVLSGVNQVAVKPQIGLTFANALRAFLRQDPDILMVGEIRDKETAEIAVQAALTGHLLLSTLHTNSASGAVTRLLDMGIDDYLLTSTLHVVLAQRLVRRLCTQCKEEFDPGDAARERFKTDAPRWYRAVGCASCQSTGYRGRTAILEALRVTEAVRAKILRSGDASEIEQTAVAEGMRTMWRHGLERVAAGETTLEEVLRVTANS